MREDRPSETAAIVAVMRGLAPWLPEGGQLAEDPYGLRFARPWMRPLLKLPRRMLLSRGMLARLALWMQLRTRALDDYVKAFRGQVVLLGAGFDCRALRLPGKVFFEVDHPATQRRKRAVVGTPEGVQFVSWNFESQPMSELPAKLASLGHVAARPTLTIWEGVTPFLSEAAIAASVAAVRVWSSPGSQLAFTYIERRAQTPFQQALVALVGEPWRFGWHPDELPAWMAAHGMKLLSDESDAELAARLLPPSLAARLRLPGRHVALAEPA
jgi:methyltransferase (TIGR00027 family)